MSCQPPTVFASAPPLLSHRRPAPNGSSYIADALKMFGWPVSPLFREKYWGIGMLAAKSLMVFEWVYAAVTWSPLLIRRLKLICTESYTMWPRFVWTFIGDVMPMELNGWLAAPRQAARN